MPPLDIPELGEKIKVLAAKADRAQKDPNIVDGSENELLDAIDELRATLMTPQRWLWSSFNISDIAALQLAFEHRFFQLVPLSMGSYGNLDIHGSGSRFTAVNKPPLTQENSTVYPSMSASSIAREANLPEDRVLRVMRVLACSLMFHEIQEEIFTHTTLSAKIARSIPSAGGKHVFSHRFKACSSFSDSIANGKRSAWEEYFGWTYDKHSRHESVAYRAEVVKLTAANLEVDSRALAKLDLWSTVSRVVHVRGGKGGFLEGLLKFHPHLRGVCVDVPEVIHNAKVRVSELPPESYGVFNRIEFHNYDHYTPRPQTQPSIFILYCCLHDKTLQQTLHILQGATKDLIQSTPPSRLLIIETLLPRWDAYPFRNQTKQVRQQDLETLICTGGRERTLDEYIRLVKSVNSGYQFERVWSLSNQLSGLLFHFLAA